MTKNEWEKALKKSMASLPKDEVSRVLAYYDELFEDKAESGMSETEIIREFGDPSDAAEKILGESEVTKGGNKSDAKHTGGSAKKIVFLVPLILLAALFAVLTLSVLASGVGAVVCGAVEFVFAFVKISSGFWAAVAKIGVGIGLVGAGILLFVLGMKMGQICYGIFKKYFGSKSDGREGEQA